MRKICIILVALVLSMLFLGCAITDDTQQSDHANAELPNPWDEWSSLEDAEKAVGFEFGLPAVITDSYKSDSFRTLNNELIEVVYHDGKYEVTIRKQKGEGQDISGDYNEYLEQNKEERSGAIIEWFWGLSDNRTSYNPSKVLIDHNGFSWSLVAPKGYWGDSAEDFIVAILKDY